MENTIFTQHSNFSIGLSGVKLNKFMKKTASAMNEV